MTTTPNLNNQHAWGGQPFQHHMLADSSSVVSSSIVNEQDQPTLVARGQQNAPVPALSQAEVIASSSDNLFNPVTHDPSSYVFKLQNVPSQPRPHAYNSLDTFNRPLPYRSPFSSYNNPTFRVPSKPPHALYNQAPIPPVNAPFPPPPVPHVHSRSALPPQPQFEHTYNYPYPPTYNLPPIHNQYPQPTYNPPPVFNQFSSTQPAYQQHPIPVQYFNQLPPVPVTSPVPSSLKALPTVTHIQILTSKADFFAWDEGVNTLIRAYNLLGHILEPSAFVDPARPDLAPTPAPVLSLKSSPQDIEASNRWWADDNIAQHILLSRLGTIPRGLLPASNIATRTALSIYTTLRQHYGTSNFADCTELLNSLHNSVCTTGRVQEYVSKWRVGLSKLQSVQFMFNIKICVSFFVRGLPPIPAFNSLRADLPRRINAIPHDQDFGAFISLTETVLELDVIFKSTAQSTARAPRQLPAPPTTSSLSTATATAPDPSNIPKKEQNCSNCKSRGLRYVGHTDATCFHPGGGMEGRREEYFSSRIHAMFAECLENTFLLSEPSLPPDPGPSSDSPIISPALDSELFLPPIANLSVASFVPNTDFREDLYDRSDFKLYSHMAMATVDFETTAMVSLLTTYNALLDSGCTHHIVRDRTLFRRYTEQPVSVGTANCGSLEALGTGDVEFKHPFGDRHIIFTLKACLYAPSAPINLISVGALAERGMSCLFSPGGLTKLFFPKDHPRLPDFSFSLQSSIDYLFSG